MVKKYEQLGPSALIQDARGSRHRSYLTDEEERAFLKEQFTCSTPGQFVTITEMHLAYQNKIGKAWAPKCLRPHVYSYYIHEYRYCYGSVDAHNTGESFFIIAEGCNTDWMNIFLKQLSETYPNDYILLVWTMPCGINQVHWRNLLALDSFQPYTPEMNLIEQVWAEIRKRGFKNKAFKTLDNVIDKLQEVIQNLHWSDLKSIVHRE